jgi:Asp-tRNA(Asn)/Glu-tRNA(Gln) amidotransferase A subunit family amidase
MAVGMSEFVLHEATIADVHAAMERGTLTSARLVEMYLERIKAFDKKGPALNAVIAINPDARAIADQLDAEFSRAGFVGPLHGIPILLKDNVNTKDMPTTGGSTSLEGFVPPTDATIVEKLKAAGGIILAKVNLHEFAVWGETISSLGGQTRNPYDLSRTPGGSSGGTGAGLAANYAMLGIGTDTVNSIRSPASANSIVGIRPTVGLVSRSGIIPYSSVQDTAGPMARTVTDAVKMLNVIVGSDADDPATAASSGRIEADYTRYLAGGGLKGARIGVLETLFGDGEEHQEVNAIVRGLIERIRQGGAATVSIQDSALDAAVLASDVSVHLYDFKPDLDVYLSTPTFQTPVKSLSEVIASGKFSPGVEAELRKGFELNRDSAEYRERFSNRLKLRDRVLKILTENNLDALIFPHQQRLVVPIGSRQVERNGALGSVTGFPSIAVPAGFSTPDGNAPVGVPVGVELLGRPWNEGKLISLAYGIEQAVRCRVPPQSTPPLR